MTMPKVVAIVGSKKSGKTTTVENLIREFVKRKYKVAAIKHVSEKDFTIDTAGKDTWRFAQAGAQTIVSASATEVTTIEKKPLETFSINDLLKKCEGNDFIFTEGFKSLMSREQDIQKVVVVKSAQEVESAMKLFYPILAFSGPYSSRGVNEQVQYADGLREPEKLANIIEDYFKEKIVVKKAEKSTKE